MKPLVCGLAAVLACLVCRPASAESILFTGTGPGANSVTLNASALFDISGTSLTITLRNVGDSSGSTGTDVQQNALTGLFFDLPNGISLTPVTATIAAGSLVNGNLCDVGPCNASTTNVGGEFRYSTTGIPSPADRGIASSSYSSTFGTSANFPSSPTPPNLDGYSSVDGPNFSIIAPISLDNPFLPNTGSGSLSEPVIEGAVQFALTIGGGTLTAAQLQNVSFQYGKNLGTDPNIQGSQSVPEPATALLALSGLAITVRRISRTRAHRA